MSAATLSASRAGCCAIQASRLIPRTNSMAMKSSLVVRADLVHGDDVGVRHPGHRLGLTQHAVAGLRVFAQGLAAQDLDGDLAIELVVVGGVDDAHAALTDDVEDLEAAELHRGGGAAREQLLLEEALADRVRVVVREGDRGPGEAIARGRAGG